MKRISISAIVLLTVAAGAAHARPVHGGCGFGHNSNRYRVRWSMYTHGLISGPVYYSPYATGHGSSHLVEGNVRYSPYAFGGGHNGLVVDDRSSYSSGFAAAYFPVFHRPVSAGRAARLSGTSRSRRPSTRVLARKSYKETVEDRKAERAVLARVRQERAAIRANDGKEIIVRYLRDNNIDFRVTRVLGIGGKTVSIDFMLNDGKTILQYWNPAEMPSKQPQQARQRKVFERYVESWKASLAKHLQTGGNVHQIISSDRDDILAKLPQCPGLDGIEKVYAVARD